MCGIIGIMSQDNVVPRLVETLKRLEYRGYDSSGLAVADEKGISFLKAKGKIVNLEEKLEQTSIVGRLGIAHTRWATHGEPSEANAHPHTTDKVAVVHNGIIENYRSLRETLQKKGYHFKSQTDTEVIAHLLTDLLKTHPEPSDAFRKTLSLLEGAYALAVIFNDFPTLMLCARKGSPLAIGQEKNDVFVSSDAVSLAPLSSTITYLEEGDHAFIQEGKYAIFTETGEPVERKTQKIAHNPANTQKGNYPHYMLKEIHEQDETIKAIVSHYLRSNEVMLPLKNPLKEHVKRLTLVACGTSYYAGCVAKHWFEKSFGIAVEVDIASEFRYREPPLAGTDMCVFISQSGETADTLAALRYAKASNALCVALVNVTESSLAREADEVLPLLAGPEIGVASTKAFTAQLCTLLLMGLALKKKQSAQSLAELKALPSYIQQVFSQSDAIKAMAKQLKNAKSMLFIGRGCMSALAAEGALKMKELTYIHAEAYAAGELKHGPIALLDEDMPVVVLAPDDDLFEKTASNLVEVSARGAQVFLLSNKRGVTTLSQYCKASLALENTNEITAPFTYSVALQLLAYHTATLKGTDVDQPRNLAKSVTVE